MFNGWKFFITRHIKIKYFKSSHKKLKMFTSLISPRTHSNHDLLKYSIEVPPKSFIRKKGRAFKNPLSGNFSGEITAQLVARYLK